MNNSNISGKKILIAEDEKAYRQALLLKLKNAGFDAVGVADGQEAFDLLKEKKWDLCILDLIMHKMIEFRTGNGKRK